MVCLILVLNNLVLVLVSSFILLVSKQHGLGLVLEILVFVLQITYTGHYWHSLWFWEYEYFSKILCYYLRLELFEQNNGPRHSETGQVQFSDSDSESSGRSTRCTEGSAEFHVSFFSLNDGIDTYHI